MRRVTFLVLLSLLPGFAEKPKKSDPKTPKPPDLIVLKMDVRREGKIVLFDGTVRNGSNHSFKGITLFFEFLEFNGRLISRKTIQVTAASVEPGEESEVQAQTVDMPRAVHYRLDAEDRDGRYLTLDRPGPFPIE